MKKLTFKFLLTISISAGLSAYAQQVQDFKNVIIKRYVISPEGKVSIFSTSQRQWQAMQPGGRLSLLETLYYANSKTKSQKGNRSTTCFEGNSEELASAFFSQDRVNHLVNFIDGGFPVVKPTMGKLGIYYKVLSNVIQNQNILERNFALDQCATSGKGIITGSEAEVKKVEPAKAGEELPKFPEKLSEQELAELAKKGFGLEDNSKHTGLPTFQLKTDFNKIPKEGFESDLPWRKTKLNIKNQKDALLLSLMLQKYVYEGMIPAGVANSDLHFNAFRNQKRYWCHMPWLQVGVNGRESVHGLTKELDLKPSPYMKSYSTVAKGTNWGVAYYNSVACDSINQIFGWTNNLKLVPNFQNIQFKDGAVSYKLLFTTSADVKFKDAYTWKAHVSAIGQSERSLQPVKHLQMDISIRDASIIGTQKSNNNWIMLTYYYDATYDYKNEFKELLAGTSNPLENMNLPIGLLKMRPMGIQVGFGPLDSGDTVLFPGAETNEKYGRLNGPADNPRSSCFSCHGTAGANLPMVPGIMSNADFAKINQTGKHFDFGQQVQLAFKNYNSFILPPKTAK